MFFDLPTFTLIHVVISALAGFNRFHSRPVSAGLIVLFSVALVVNGLAVGVFGQEVAERYMTRVIWLLPAAVFITLLFRDVRNVKAYGGNRH